ncbi:hypothetical protein [Caballeronia sp. GAFFF3]|uniref:hypothetical protein n=1 Tax=Caballeronia sp. GAFFF3 TaxID=2921759 RepID=UPI002028FBEB|nr:hypothetical protein [Caballeronia sp. GAFFF3]
MALTFADAMRMAAKDPKFATDLVQNPQDYQQTFNLSQQQVEGLKNASLNDVLTHASGAANPAIYAG